MTTTLVLVVLTTVCVGSSLEYAVMSLSKAYARRRVSISPASPPSVPSPFDHEQETLFTAFLPPARDASISSEGSASSTRPRMLESQHNCIRDLMSVFTPLWRPLSRVFLFYLVMALQIAAGCCYASDWMGGRAAESGDRGQRP